MIPLARAIVYESEVLPGDRCTVRVPIGYPVEPEWPQARIIREFMLDRWVKLGYVTPDDVALVYHEATMRAFDAGAD